jgi:hypothetical protein
MNAWWGWKNSIGPTFEGASFILDLLDLQT